MNIIFYPSWYQLDNKHNNGIFFKDQAEAVYRNYKHNLIFLVTNINWQDKKYGMPKIKIEEKKDELMVWEYSVSLPLIFKRIRIQEILTLKMLESAIKKYIKKYGKVDLIHAQSFLKAGYDACRLSKKYNIPVITTEHLSSLSKDLSLHSKEKLLYTINNSKKIISVSSYLDSMIENYQLSKDKRVIIPNLVNEKFYFDKNTRKNDIFTFISIGHLIPGKRIDFLIKGFINAFSKFEKVQLLIIGDGQQKKELEKIIEENDRTSQIKLLGSLTHDEVSQQLKRSHVLIHTSELETFGVVLIEALASGLPIVCTRCGGPNDILNNYGCFPIDVNDFEGLKRSIKEVKQNYNKYNLEKISCETIERFNGRVISKQINDVYESVVK